MEKQKVNIITQNSQVEWLIQKIDKISDSNSSILLVGETGVGKEIFADYVHYSSSRADRPFVKIGLSALPADLLESELFGHEKGSFTSAHHEKKGLFEIANTGSIFLDDIDDVPMTIQTKLLRVLESKELMKIGGTKPIPIDVRLITASKIDLKILIDQGKFRSDLFYRINVVPIHIPPLRDRKEDVEALSKHFLNHYAPEKELGFSPQALNALINYSWPGNVRELRNVVQRLSLFSKGEIDVNELPGEISSEDPMSLLIKACDKCFIDQDMSFEQVVNCLEVNLMKEALRKSDCNQTQAAKLLKLSLSTFRDKLKKNNVHCESLKNVI